MLSERFAFICCFSSRHFSFVIVKLKFSDFLLNLIISFFNRPILKKFNFDQPFLSPGVMWWVATKHLGSINQAAMTVLNRTVENWFVDNINLCLMCTVWLWIKLIYIAWFCLSVLNGWENVQTSCSTISS